MDFLYAAMQLLDFDPMTAPAAGQICHCFICLGPGIYEIGGEHEMPRLFKDYYNEGGGHLLLFKVPRRIERAKASPKMDLYDYVVGAFDTYIYILKRSGKNVIQKKINYCDIFAIEDIHALLKGSLKLYTESEPVVIDYNTVSEEIILKLINIIERNINHITRTIVAESLPTESDPNDPKSIDVLFENLIGKLRVMDTGLKLTAYQPRIYVRLTRELKYKLKYEQYSLSKLAFIINDKELIILRRGTPVRNKRKEELDYSYLYIPFQNIKSAGISGFDEDQYLERFELRAGNITFAFVFEGANSGIKDLSGKLSGLSGA